MKYDSSWDLSTIPDKLLRSEWGRRNAGKRITKKGGYAVSCTCGKCRTCKMREWQRQRRIRIAKEQNETQA